jgi:ABC-type lipoprotein export system ATPase subunit
MKITGIKIDEYRQFKDINFDFTYPEGHPKEGQPLEKVCFIGQSGTGKTTLLKMLREYSRYLVYGLNNLLENGPLHNLTEKEIPSGFLQNLTITSAFGAILTQLNITKDTKINTLSNWIEQTKISDEIKNTNKLSIYISDSVANEAEKLLLKEVEHKDPFEFIKTQKQVDEDETKRRTEINRLSVLKGLFLGEGAPKALWDYILSDINDYDLESKSIALKLIQNTDGFSTNKLIADLVKWKSENINPRITLAEKCLNPLLYKFYLEVDTENASAPIVVKTRSGNTIVNSILSTGTKQLVATALPLYKLDTRESTIFFDEPERSLFPDIQRGLINYYTSLAPKAQFFFATHSPIIASAFEPCERFVLYFNENGEVKYHNGVAPEGDDPNDILRQDFAMAELMLQKGLDEYERYRQLAMQIRAETDEEKKNQLIAERLELGNRYNFAGQYAQSK